MFPRLRSVCVSKHALILTLIPWCLLTIQSDDLFGDSKAPIIGKDVVFAEKDGLIAVEAEHFFQQEKTDKRAFHLTTSRQSLAVKPDGDPAHVAGASGGAYLEILPDTRRTKFASRRCGVR